MVKKAKSIVEGFYKSKDLTAFSQEDASPPKVTWKLGSSRNGNLGSSVIAMLDTIVEDFQKEQKDADAAEEKAEEELAKVRAWAVALDVWPKRYDDSNEDPFGSGGKHMEQLGKR